jgi:hypothetical protein
MLLKQSLKHCLVCDVLQSSTHYYYYYYYYIHYFRVTISYLYHQCTFLGHLNDLSPIESTFPRDNCKNFNNTSHKYQYFHVQSCPIPSLYNVLRVFPLVEASLELSCHEPVQHHLPFNLNSRNFHIWG